MITWLLPITFWQVKFLPSNNTLNLIILLRETMSINRLTCKYLIYTHAHKILYVYIFFFLIDICWPIFVLVGYVCLFIICDMLNYFSSSTVLDLSKNLKHYAKNNLFIFVFQERASFTVYTRDIISKFDDKTVITIA